MPKNAPIIDRWLEKISLADLDDCWLWTASRDGRHAIGIDLDSRNGDLARERVGMFLEIQEGAA